MIKFTSSLKAVLEDIEKGDAKLLSKAANYMRGKIKDKIKKREKSRPGEPPGVETGNLLKGIKSVCGKTVAWVGAMAPAYHAILLEYGTKKMAKRPFLYKTFDEEREIVKEILTGQRV